MTIPHLSSQMPIRHEDYKVQVLLQRIADKKFPAKQSVTTALPIEESTKPL